MFDHDYFSLGVWEFPEREDKAAHSGRGQRPIKVSWASVESRSGPSYASKGSGSSAWSTLEFPLAARKHPRSTLLMWASTTLNLPLMSHLLGVGASACTLDELGQTALHYAAAPLMEASFKDVKDRVRLLLADQASVSTKPSIRIAHKPPPMRSVKLPLELVVGKEHAALDPRTSFKWGPGVHRTCISAFLDPLSTDNERSELAETALPHALSHDMCPIDSIELLCKHAVGSGQNADLRSDVLDTALHCALMNSAAEPIILILLDHGASPNSESYILPLIMAINPKVSEAVVIALLQHGADPHLRPRKGPLMTPLEYAKYRGRQDVIDLLKNHGNILKLPDLALNRSAEPVAKLSSRGSPSGSRSSNISTGLDGVNELDELIDLDDDLMYKVSYGPKDESKGCMDSGRPWFLGIPSFSLSQLRRNSKK